MDIIETGHKYLVYDLKGGNPQEILFTRRNSLGGFDPGTTNEELVDVLLARMYYLNGINPNPHNKVAIILLKAIRDILGKIVEKKVKNETRKRNSHGEERRKSYSWQKPRETTNVDYEFPDPGTEPVESKGT